MTISGICICGAGTMGYGIAQVTALAGLPTILFDVNEASLTKGRQQLETNIKKLANKQKVTMTQQEQALANLVYTASIKDCVAPLVIEAIIEKMDAKVLLIRQLEAINAADTILATNTSSLSVNRLAQQLTLPGRFIGIHFFNPVYLMRLVEIVKATTTTAETVKAATAFVTRLTKTSVVCNDAPGFIVNRVARPYYLEAMKLVEEGKADMETVDALMEATGFKMGPFALMDFIGNDINYAASCSVYEALDKPARLTPSNLQKQLVQKGHLGKKTGKGFYQY